MIVRINMVDSEILAQTEVSVNNIKDGERGLDRNLLDWVEDWDSHKVDINTNSILSPRMFAGKNDGTNVALNKIVSSKTNTYENSQFS